MSNNELVFSEMALQQLKLMQENDYTLENKFPRIQVSGKGCGGFDYEIGFTEKSEADLVFEFQGLKYIMDPFTAFYLKKGTVNFEADYKNNQEGFHVINDDEKNYQGKFFKNTEMVPHFLEKKDL
ncbi:MAG: hypothetical protein JNM93_13715 [Bacteriovoracaceae bacterium]|nr:hypothetical protein [Bacteriovoracaceae bacterium]